MSVKLREKRLYDPKFRKDVQLIDLDNIKKSLDDKTSKYKAVLKKYNSLKDKKYTIGKSYYLDINHNGKRFYDFLGIKSYTKGPNKDTLEQRNEKKRIAESITAQREIELISKGVNYTPNHIKNINFFDFADNFIENYTKKDDRMIKSPLKKFKEFVKDDNLSVNDITPDLME